MNVYEITMKNFPASGLQKLNKVLTIASVLANDMQITRDTILLEVPYIIPSDELPPKTRQIVFSKNYKAPATAKLLPRVTNGHPVGAILAVTNALPAVEKYFEDYAAVLIQNTGAETYFVMGIVNSSETQDFKPFQSSNVKYYDVIDKNSLL